MAMAQPILEARDLTKRYALGETTVDALRGVSLTVQPGEFVALMGSSGSGKSTLLHLLGGLDRPTSGEVILGGETISGLGDDAATRLRRDRTGFVFQFFNLIPLLNAAENVGLPFTIAGQDPRRGEAGDRVRDAFELVDLRGKEQHRPDQLSAGEQQRVAIARALVNRPATSTSPPAARSSRRSGVRVPSAARRSCWSPTMPRPPPTPTGSR
jgi:putative ABC transport system ATP-binding protein